MQSVRVIFNNNNKIIIIIIIVTILNNELFNSVVANYKAITKYLQHNCIKKQTNTHKRHNIK